MMRPDTSHTAGKAPSRLYIYIYMDIYTPDTCESRQGAEWVAPFHEGSPVKARNGGRAKYVVRSDVMYSFG